MFGLFGRKQRDAAQRALDEQREFERSARRELAELALAQNFTADEILLIKEQQAAESRAIGLAMMNVATMSPAERVLNGAAYAQAVDEQLRLSARFWEMIRAKGGIEPPRLN